MTLLQIKDQSRAQGTPWISNPQQVFGGHGAVALDASPTNGPTVFQVDSASVENLRNDAGCGSGVYPYGDLTKVMSRALDQRSHFQPLTAAKHFPIDRDAGWAEYVELYSMNGAGEAKIICCANDFPRVSVEGCTFKTGFVTLGTGYEICYSTRQQQSASKSGVNYETQLIRTAYRALRERVNQIAYKGDTKNNVLGLGNNPFIPMQVSPYRLDNAIANPQAILAILTEASTMNYVTSGMAAMMPDAVIGPPSLMQYLARRPANSADANCVSANLISQFASYAPHIKYWGMAPEMENIGPNCERGLFFYKRDRDCISWQYPIDLEVLEPYFDGYSYQINMIARVGSLWPNYPEDCLLLVGV